MSLVTTRNVCIICLKRFTSGDNSKNNFIPLQSNVSCASLNDCDDLYVRFLVFVNRHLKLRTLTDRFLHCASDVKNENGEKNAVHAFCEHCHQLISYICDRYKELQTIKLHLVWKLSQVGQLMKKSTKSVSQKLARGLVVSMSQQLNLKAVRPLEMFRKALQLRCSHTKHSTPYVTVHQGLFPDEWKFTYSATKKTLIQLIVVFILASSAIKEDKSLSPSPKIEHRRRRPKRKVLLNSQDLKNNFGSPAETLENIKTEAAGENDLRVDDDNAVSDDFQQDLDSDWSKGAASPLSVGSGCSQVSQAKEVLPRRKTRWNLRERRTANLRSKDDDESAQETENDEKKERTLNNLQKKRQRKSLVKKAELKCPQCPKLFVDARGLSKHLKLIHRSSIQYSCKKCGMRFGRRNDLRLHNSKIHVSFTARGISRLGRRIPVETTCTQCSEVFPTRMAMVRHRKSSHKIYWSKHECPYCYRTVVTKERLRLHMERHEKDTINKELNLWYCEVCSKHFYKIDSLYSHMKDVHKDKYTCNVCNTEHDTGKLLRDHLLTHHETDKKSFHCQMCFRSFTSQQFYDIHRKLAHMDQRRYLCDHEQCNEIFDAIPDLNEHLKSHVEAAEANHAEQQADDDGNKLKILFCKTCEIGFMKEYNLTLHELLHTPHSKTGTGYDCPKCNKNMRYKETLVSHYNMQHGQKIKSFKCDICQREFSNQAWFHTHVRLHDERTNEGTFICDVCGVHCLDSIALSAHRRGHDPNKKGRETGVMRDYIGESREGENIIKKKIPRRTETDIMLDPSSPPPGLETQMARKRRGRPRVRPWTEKDIEKEKELAGQCTTKISCSVGNCDQNFESAYLLRKHLENTHEDEGPQIEKNIQCYYCYKRFVYPQTYDLHIRATHKNKIYGRFKCDLEACEVGQFLTMEELNEHLQTHLEPGKEISFCVKCNWGYVRPELRDIHELIHIEALENGKFSCPKCNAEYERLPFLQYHFNKDHGLDLKPHKCEECEKSYFSKDSLNAHKMWHAKIRQLGPNDLKVLVCVQCGSTYKDEYKYKKHMQEHNPENFKTCNEPGCGQTFKNHKQLWYHFRKRHDKRKKWCCEICGFQFTYRHHLISHIKTHEDPQFNCEICGLMFRRQRTLDGHIKNKHDPNRVKSHVCSLCGKSFFTDEGLGYHFDSTHKPESEWKLKCPHCPRRFYRRLLLNIHLKTCSGKNEIVKNEETFTSQKSTRVPTTRRKIQTSRKKKKRDEEEMTDNSTTEDENDEVNVKPSTRGEAQSQNFFNTLLQQPCSSQDNDTSTTTKSIQKQHFARSPLHYDHSEPSTSNIQMQPQNPVQIFPQAQFHQPFNSFLPLQSDMVYSPEHEYRSPSSSSSHSQLDSRY